MKRVLTPPLVHLLRTFVPNEQGLRQKRRILYRLLRDVAVIAGRFYSAVGAIDSTQRSLVLVERTERQSQDARMKESGKQ